MVGTVIVKDLSRLGRNYLLTGQYIELVFPSYDVRFISVSDGIDSKDGLNDLLPFHNLMNEWYCRDISKKQRAVIKQKGNSGQRLTTHVIYGYKKSDANKQVWLVDEPAAKNVRLIFDLYTAGWGITQICHKLEEDGVLSPSAYMGQIKDGSTASKNPYHWSVQTVSQMLARQEYCGDTVNFKSERFSFKSKRVIRHAPAEYRIFENTHEAIISRDVYKQAQIRLSQRKRISPIKEQPLFSGFLVCGDCGKRMYAMRTRSGTGDCYVCAGYRKAVKDCTSHYIRADRLLELVLGEVQRLADDYAANPAAFERTIRRNVAMQDVSEQSKVRHRLEEISERVRDIELYIQKLYEDKVQGHVTQEVFSTLSSLYLGEKSDLESEKNALETSEAESISQFEKTENFLRNLRSVGSVQEITPEILGKLVEKIEVFEGEVLSGCHKKTANIKVHFKGIGTLG